MQKIITLSYDDGCRDDLQLVKILNDYGIKATFNLNAGLFGEDKNAWRLTKEEAVNLYKGHEIGLHGYKHLYLNQLSESEIFDELSIDKNILEKIFSTKIRGGAYAYGIYTPYSLNVLKQLGIDYARSVQAIQSFDIPENWLELKPTCHHKHPELSELLDKFEREEKFSLFYLWGHSYEFAKENNWEIIIDFCKKASKIKDVQFLTNIEAYDAINKNT